MRLHHIGIEVAELSSFMDFFVKEQGYVISTRIPFPGYESYLLACGQILIELTSPLSKTDCHGDPSIHFCLQVNNLDGWLRYFAFEGIYPSDGPYLLKNGWRTVFFTLEGWGELELLELSCH